MKLLDHGYIKLVESYGSDQSIIEAARMSTDKGFLGWGTKDKPGDEKLLRYLYKHKHSTPFEMAGFIIEVKAPIFVYRQWHRHRTQSYNEMSARYTPLPDESYMPTMERLMQDGGKNKQARSATDVELTTESAAAYRAFLEAEYSRQEQFYQWALNKGIPKELARAHIGVARYSKMRAHANLRNWLAFLTLRMDPHAQWEIRQYANAIGAFVEKVYPRTWELFLEGASW